MGILEACNAHHIRLVNNFIRVGPILYRHSVHVGIHICTYFGSLVANLLLFCYDRNFIFLTIIKVMILKRSVQFVDNNVEELLDNDTIRYILLTDSKIEQTL